MSSDPNLHPHLWPVDEPSASLGDWFAGVIAVLVWILLVAFVQ